ncbi:MULTISPECIES: hypothetical protein [Mycolicibacterium]|uniref:hypothetical protein n=1 Tax=Mycolicibacterium monacense TaxID=85693 RepID=UPI0007EB361E|nr:hypothetical protein [Mycolicibacterium monacense]OBB73102.1 hypothetical protein A6B34_15405 [Mycolicibacterium monacense]
MARVPEITAILGGSRFTRLDVLERERERARRALSKLGAPVSSAEVDQLREALRQRKAELGHSGIEGALGRDVRWSTRVARLTATASRGRRALSTIEMVASQGSANGFVDWFEKRTSADDEAAMLAAHPDHFLFRTDAEGSQEVWETNGGSPLAARFFIDYDDTSSLQTPVDREYPVQLAGVARLRDGLAIGGVRHQFRDEGEGFRALLTVEFPALTLPTILRGHRWHLAIEFSNWIEASAAGEG